MPFYSNFFGLDYILVIIALVIVTFAQIMVSSAFNKYSKIGNINGHTGYDAARRILDENGLNHIRIEKVAGKLTDHYSPEENVIRLSDEVMNSTSVAAIGVAAHEAGHAVQYSTGYIPIKFRNAIIPVTKFGSSLAMPLFLLGLFFSLPILVELGIILFSAIVIFQLVTLPVEFNASSRALKIIEDQGILQTAEMPYAKRMLSAAAMTYVAALLSSILSLIRLIAISNRRR